jgi:hypothetical protein
MCTGSGMIGDPCMQQSDCAVGTCCTTGPNQGKCALSC